MKKIILITIVSVFFVVSCNNNQCKTDSEFKESYYTMLDKITSYGKQFDTDGTVVFIPEVVSSFLDCTDYLKLLTHHEFRYIIAGQPIYENQSYWKADIQDLEKWYQENKCDMTKEKADSTVNAR